MISIEAVLKNEVTSQITGFIEQNIKIATGFLCASLPNKQIDLQLAVHVEPLEIKYTEIGWLSDAPKKIHASDEISFGAKFRYRQWS